MGDLINNEVKISVEFRVCPICGKKYIAAPEHAWRIGAEKVYKLVCSYTCMRAWEKENLNKRSEKDDLPKNKKTKSKQSP